MAFDPVPDPIAAGWTKEGDEPHIPAGTSLRINDATNAGTCKFFVADPAAFGKEIQLSPSVLLSSGFSVDAEQSTGVHVTINDGEREIRAVVLGTDGGGVRVAIKLLTGYSTGFILPTNQASFQLKRLLDGSAYLAANEQPAETIPRLQLALSTRPGQQTIEFGADSKAGVVSTEWLTLGLTPVVPEQPFASFEIKQVKIKTKDGDDGDEGEDKNDRVRIKGNFAVGSNASLDPTTQSISLTLTRAGETTPFWPPAGVMPIKAGFAKTGVNFSLSRAEKERTGIESFEIIRGRTFHCADRRTMVADRTYQQVVVELRIGDQVARQTVNLAEKTAGNGNWRLT
jgi:hypothetical protein